MMRFLALLVSIALTARGMAQDVAHVTPADSASKLSVLDHADLEATGLLSAKFSANFEEEEPSIANESTAALPLNPEPTYRVERTAQNRASELPTHRRAWVLLTAAQHGSAVFDAWSTRQALSNGHAYERDILVKPFANSDAVYPALQILPLALDFLSHRMLRSSHSINRKTWWVPQAVATAGFIWCGTRNLRVADKQSIGY